MNRASCWTALVLLAALAGGLAQAQSTRRASVDSSGVQGNSLSYGPSISIDGRWVAFRSEASNLVPGDTNGALDVFVFDQLGSTTERVSVDSGGAQGNQHSEQPAISGDGRWVAFHSLATNLVAGDTNGIADLFLHDRVSGATERVSVGAGGAQADGESYLPRLAGTAHFVVFLSDATNLVPGDTNGVTDVFVRDTLLGTTARVSVDSSGAQANGPSACASLSSSGTCVVFLCDATNLVPGDINGARDCFVYDLQTGTTTRVSVDSNGLQGNSDCDTATLSADGRFVAFNSSASNLVAGDTFGYWDVFVHDRLTHTTERVSVDSSGAQANWNSYTPSISADGRFIAFESYASNLVAGDTNIGEDVFVHDRLAGQTERVSVDSGGAQANGGSGETSISGDGRYVAFSSFASNLVLNDTGGIMDTFVRDRGPQAPSVFCAGDGSAGACPCANDGASGRGCDNSAFTGGAFLSSAGVPSLANDTLVLTSAGELPSALSIVLQGSSAIVATGFGDGLRCAGGVLKRLYTRNATGGIVSVPQPGDPSISARSAALGDGLGAGTTRHYQTYYRDPQLAFCAAPAGNTWNISSGVSIMWGQ